MTEAFDANDIPGHCRVCLTLVKDDPEAVSIGTPHQPSGGTFLDLLNETALQFPTESVSEIPSYICQQCCSKLENVYQFRSQCTEMYNFYMALHLAKETSSEMPLVELIASKAGQNILPHLFRLGIISKVDLSVEQFLAEIGFIKKEADDQVIQKSSNLVEIDEIKVETSPPRDSDESNFQPLDDASGSDWSDDEPLAKICRKTSVGSRKSGKTINSSDGFHVCPESDCQEPLGTERYADHLKQYHRYGCKQCGLVLLSKYTMGKHVSIHRDRPLSVKCTFCERMFPHIHKMRAHAKDVHLQLANNYECDECNEKFESRKLLNEHREIHLPKDCSTCLSKFDQYSKLLCHVRRIHPEKCLSCPQCPRKFLQKYLLERHMLDHPDSTVDNPEDNYELLTIKTIAFFGCPQCDKQFTSEAHRLAHMPSHDPASRPKIVVNKRSKEELEKLEYKYQCDQCNACYRLPTSLDSHMKNSHLGAPFVCDICGAFYKTKAYLNQHVTYKHTKDFRYFCDFCPKAFATSSDLQRHRRVHTNERPYQCDQCESRFKTNDGYRKHMRSHSREKIYHCDLCERSFMCHSSLKTHKISHTNEKAFKCFYCVQHFNVPKNRRRHIMRKHPGLPTNQAPD